VSGLAAPVGVGAKDGGELPARARAAPDRDRQRPLKEKLIADTCREPSGGSG
jgi:hypothetical protein